MEYFLRQKTLVNGSAKGAVTAKKVVTTIELDSEHSENDLLGFLAISTYDGKILIYWYINLN